LISGDSLSPVVLVAARSLLWVDPGWWGELGPPIVSDVDCPISFVEQAVVEPADQDRVAESGSPAIDPVNNMMPVAPVKCIFCHIWVSGT